MALLLLARPCGTLRYIAWCRAWAFATGVHLTLPDALQWDWLWPDLLAWGGAALVAWRGAVLGWLMCATGLLLPMLLLEDQLTQSLYLLLGAICAIALFAGSGAGRDARLGQSLPAAIRVLTVGVYAIAALHKLNRDFLDPEVSCATGGLGILADNWGLPGIDAESLRTIWPLLFLLVEIGLATLLIVRPGAGMVLGLLMHIPLTIVFAPSFAFAMISGWACLLGEAELEHLLTVMKLRWKWVVSIGGALGVTSFALYMRLHWIIYPWWSFKEILLWIGLAWLVAAWWRRPAGCFGWWSAWREGMGPSRALVVLVGALFVLNALTPYTGLRFHHAGAMLSNLRVDEGCWNSLLFPESMRALDPHIRIDEAVVGDVPGAGVLREEIESRLWNRRSLVRARNGWCEAGAGPLRVTGTHSGERFVVEDLCSALPFEPPVLPRTRPFQENLLRECPQQCIH